MRTEDKTRFAELVTAIAEIYGKSMSQAGLKLWWSALERFSYEQVEAAMTRHSQDADRGQWMPKPADIVRQIEGTPDDAAMEAWGKVDQAVRRIGYGPHIVFDDPKIHKVLQEMGGFAQFGKATEEEMGYLRHAFTKRYASCRDVTGYPAKIAGWHTDGQVRFVGDEAKCQAVLERGSAEPVAISDASEVGARLLEHPE